MVEVINRIEQGKNQENKEEEEGYRCVKKMEIRSDPQLGKLYLSMAKAVTTRQDPEEAKPENWWD